MSRKCAIPRQPLSLAHAFTHCGVYLKLSRGEVHRKDHTTTTKNLNNLPATKQRNTQQHPPEWLYQEEKEEVGRPPHLGDFQARGSGFSRRSLIWPFYHTAKQKKWHASSHIKHPLKTCSKKHPNLIDSCGGIMFSHFKSKMEK